MSYVRAARLGDVVPPADPTSQALTILGISALPCLPIAFGVAGGMYVGKGKSAVAPVAGALIGAVVSVLWLRSSVAAGTSSVSPRFA